jgi:hopanoid biosynthesis associated protein HpnK
VKQLIVTADDFGLTPGVNEAVEEAHRHGILTAASLMVGAPAAADAIARARRLPTLRVGLHVVVVEGRPVLPAAEVPDLVDASGAFSTHLVRAGIRYFFSPRVRRQLAAEIRAQFEAFAATGLPLDHANSHNHMHLHPTVLALILATGREFGLRAVRVPYEPPWPSWRAARRQPLQRFLSAGLLSPWMALLRSRVRRSGMAANRSVFGRCDSGRMDTALLSRLLAVLPRGVSEIYFHPATQRSPELDRQMPGYGHTAELAALLSPEVAAVLRREPIERVAFSDLVPPAPHP